MMSSAKDFAANKHGRSLKNKEKHNAHGKKKNSNGDKNEKSSTDNTKKKSVILEDSGTNGTGTKNEKDASARSKAEDKLKEDIALEPLNLKKETDEIAEYVIKKHAKRKILSNWSRYEIPEESTTDEDSVTPDFMTLVNSSIISGSHYQFKHEKEWRSKPIKISERFHLNIQSLASSLASVPFYKRQNLSPDMFTKEELSKMDESANYMLNKHKNISKSSSQDKSIPENNITSNEEKDVAEQQSTTKEISFTVNKNLDETLENKPKPQRMTSIKLKPRTLTTLAKGVPNVPSPLKDLSFSVESRKEEYSVSKEESSALDPKPQRNRNTILEPKPPREQRSLLTSKSVEILQHEFEEIMNLQTQTEQESKFSNIVSQTSVIEDTSNSIQSENYQKQSEIRTNLKLIEPSTGVKKDEVEKLEAWLDDFLND